MPFIKISTLMPNMKKDYAFFSLKNNNNEENNNNNAGNNDLEINNNKQKKNKLSRIYKIGGGDKFINLYTKLICLYRYSFKNFPESREQFSLLIDDNTLFLIGGKSCIFTQEELWTCDLTTISWTKIKSANGSFVRFGHISIFDRSCTKIYIFGGRTKYDHFQTPIWEKKHMVFVELNIMI